MLADIVEHLVCPVCALPLRLDPGALRCPRGHSFDVARQGYVSLLVGSRPPGTADSAEMVAARAAFLAAGHFAPLERALAETVLGEGGTETALGELGTETALGEPGTETARGEPVLDEPVLDEPVLDEPVLDETSHTESFSHSPDAGRARAYGGGGTGSGHGAEQVRRRTGDAPGPVIVDAGAGTGHYAAAVLDAAGRGVGLAFDVSKHAVRRAAKAHPRVGAFVADVWRRLPIADGVADVVMNVFAPRNGPEFRRILRPGGRVVVVTPAPGHLSPLVEELGLLSVDADKERRVARSLEGFTETERREVAFGMALGPDEVRAVVGMGPSAWHRSGKELEEGITRVFSRNNAKNQESHEKVATKAEFHLSTFVVTPGAR